MTVKRSGLGRNLSALLGQSSTMAPNPHAPAPHLLAIDCLQPGKYQPRGSMDEPSLNELALSIEKQGILQPLLVRELENGRYEIIAGERRWRASQIAGLTQVPVVLKQVDDETAMAMALIENVQREDLNPMDQARAMQQLTTEFALTHQEVAELLCKSRAAVSNFLRLLALAPAVKKLLEQGDLDVGHARALLVLEEEQQHQAALLIIAKNLSVREAEQLVKRIKIGKVESTDTVNSPSHPRYQNELNILAQQLQAQVQLKPSKSGKGSLVIRFKNDKSLQKIIEHLMK